MFGTKTRPIPWDQLPPFLCKDSVSLGDSAEATHNLWMCVCKHILDNIISNGLERLIMFAAACPIPGGDF